MPVTIPVAKHAVKQIQRLPNPQISNSSQDVLKQLNQESKAKIGPILNTALGQQTSLTDERLEKLQLSVEDHGLVRTAYYAYSYHHDLVLRPEDIWFAILSQFSFYVNANSEKLRKSFVAHKGKKGLILRDPGQPDMGSMCRNMTQLIHENIVDPELREWVLPSFTTTTVDDEVVAAVIMMGTLQKYFDYVFDATLCGIPNVTLLGELSDWEDIQQRIEKLSTYGEEPAHFCSMLRPILQKMVQSFTKGPDDAGVVDFWSRIIDRQNGSGMDTLTGWMVAFCFWDEEGKCLARSLGKKPEPETLFDVIDGHSVEWSAVPSAFVSAPVTYISPDEEVIETKLVAGLVGCEATTARKYSWVEPTNDRTTVKKQSRRSLTGPSFSSFIDKVQSKLRLDKPKPEQDKPKPEQDKPKPKQDKKPKEDTEPEPSNPDDEWTPSGELNTLRPIAGWWMYEVDGEKKTDSTRDEFYKAKLENEWNGQASTGYVQRDGKTVLVEDGLPRG